MSCQPIVNAGLRAVIGSWKIIASRSPRRSESAAASSSRRLRPSNVMRPVTSPGGQATRPITESAVTLLPQPDSPTMQSVSPGESENEMPSTARAIALVGGEADAQILDREERAHRVSPARARAMPASMTSRS